MKLALAKLGKKVTVISGDDYPLEVVSFLPKFDEIVTKSFDQVDLKTYDLYLCLDTGGPNQITYKSQLIFPLIIPTVVIDHHPTNPKFGDINLVLPEVSSCSEIVFRLIKDWEIEIDKDIATCLYVGIWADTGGFKFFGVTSMTYRIASELVDFGADFNKIIFRLQSIKLNNMYAFADALTCAITYFNDRLIVTKIPLERFAKFGIKDEKVSNVKELVAFWLSACDEPEISVVIYEYERTGKVSISMRSNNPKKVWDVSKIAIVMGGGGHKRAAGGKFSGTIDEAEKFFLEILDQVYPEFKK
jgi:phosphoesterase RecJ-like protein